MIRSLFGREFEVFDKRLVVVVVKFAEEEVFDEDWMVFDGG